MTIFSLLCDAAFVLSMTIYAWVTSGRIDILEERLDVASKRIDLLTGAACNTE